MIRCIAWDLLGEHADKIDTTHLVRIANGRALYEDARPAHGDRTVRLARLETDPLRVVSRYVPWDTHIELVKIRRG